MDKNTLYLLELALKVRGENRKKVLPYFKRAIQELTDLVNNIEKENARKQQGAQQAQA